MNCLIRFNFWKHRKFIMRNTRNIKLGFSTKQENIIILINFKIHIIIRKTANNFRNHFCINKNDTILFNLCRYFCLNSKLHIVRSQLYHISFCFNYNTFQNWHRCFSRYCFQGNINSIVKIRFGTGKLHIVNNSFPSVNIIN